MATAGHRGVWKVVCPVGWLCPSPSYCIRRGGGGSRGQATAGQGQAQAAGACVFVFASGPWYDGLQEMTLEREADPEHRFRGTRACSVGPGDNNQNFLSRFLSSDRSPDCGAWDLGLHREQNRGKDQLPTPKASYPRCREMSPSHTSWAGSWCQSAPPNGRCRGLWWAAGGRLSKGTSSSQ